MNFSCWAVGTWAAGTWVEGSWCPGVTPTPVVTTFEARRWPGPSIILYDERVEMRKIKRKWREEREEIVIL